MKTKYALLMAASVCLGWFGLGTSVALAQADISASIRIEKIEKVTPTGQTPILPLSLEGTKQIYFDVTMACSNGWKPLENFYEPSASNGNQRPYLILNIPLVGESSKAGVTVLSAQGEKYTETTSSAVAYYVGPGPQANVLRFVYNVRPGDMTPQLTWATTASGAPAFGGALKAMRFSATTTDWSTAVTIGLTEEYLVSQNAPADPTVVDNGAVWGVCGYTMTIGDAGNANSGDLYQGLVPVTVTTPKNYTKVDATTGTTSTVDYPGAAAFQQTTLADNCAFWVMVEDPAQPGTWNYLNAGVTFMNPDNATLYEGTDVTGTTFPDQYAAPFSGVTEVNAATFTEQKFFVQIPTTVAAGTNVRLCYGLPPTMLTGAVAPYTYIETVMKASPVATTTGTSGYQVQSPMMSKKEFALPDGTTVTGGEISLSAGDVETLSILKKNITKLNRSGILYASVAQISDFNNARADWERYYIPLDPSVSSASKLKVSIPDDAVVGETIYRISIPGLTAAEDEPFYVKVISSPKRETITIAPDATIGTTGYEAYKSDTVSVLPYTLSVNATDSKRYFMLFPVLGDRMTEIKEGDYVVVTDAQGTEEEIEVYELLKRTVSLQQDTSTDTTDATAAVRLRLEVPANQTSATFYVLCRNDFLRYMGMLSQTVYYDDDDGTRKTRGAMSGPIFKAKTCDYSGNITGLNDECPMAVAPKIENVAPTISAATVQSSAATGTKVPFTFSVEDVVSDYLIVRMDFGDGSTETHLYVNKDDMIATLGTAGWEAHLNMLTQTYPDLATAANVKARSSLVAQQVRFEHEYDVGSANWSVTVIDSTGHSVQQTGLLTLTKAQSFTFYTINKATQPASGYVNWENKGDNATWGFGDTYTYNSLPLSPSEPNTVRVRAKPYAAGEAPNGTTVFGPTSETLDSFFYKWGVWREEYAALLPNDNGLYSNLLTINRAFVTGGGEANDPTKWQDIELAAFFVAEYLPGDALESYNVPNADPAYLYDLGDYNRDGVPDGWVLHGGDASVRALIEGASMAGQSATEDTLPASGWGTGDSAYSIERTLTNNGVVGSTAAGAAFTYLARVRGRDEALNAADGEGNWLSQPAWVVGIRPEVRELEKGYTFEAPMDASHLPAVCVNEPMQKVRLAPYAMVENAEGVDISANLAFTAEQKIPYWVGTIDGVVYPTAEGWAPVVDEDGHPIVATIAAPGTDEYKAAPYVANTVLVQTDVTLDKVNYESFKTSYNRWVLLRRARNEDEAHTWYLPMQADGATPAEVGAMYPFTTVAAMDAAIYELDENGAQKVDGAGNPIPLPVSQYIGAFVSGTSIASLDGTYAFIDSRTPEGILIDEPFMTGKEQLDETGMIDPRRTSWLERFPMAKGSDTDGDGIRNGVEYYFWYYASRKAYISTFTTPVMGTVDGERVQIGVRTQVNNALWPAIDLRHHSEANKDGWSERDGGNGTTDTFVMGRRYLQSYNPDLANPLSKGNYFEPIPVATVLSAFNLYGASAGDPDNDGLSTLEELAIGSNPIDCDSNNDGIPDGWAVHFEMSPTVTSTDSPDHANANPDRDAFAMATMELYPDYHHLFRVGTTTLEVPEAVVQIEVPYYELRDVTDANGDPVYNVDGDQTSGIKQEWRWAGVGVPTAENSLMDETGTAYPVYTRPSGSLYYDVEGEIFRTVQAPYVVTEVQWPREESGALISPNTTDTEQQALIATYDAEVADALTKLTEVDTTALADQTRYLTQADTRATEYTSENLNQVTAWANEAATILQMNPESRILRDNEVYQTFGFHPFTAWTMGSSVKLSALGFKTVNTAAFTNREEFNSAVRRTIDRLGADEATVGAVASYSTNPKTADTNEDGIPDGWTLYVGADPIITNYPPGVQDWDTDGLTGAQEFQCAGVTYESEQNADCPGWSTTNNQLYMTQWTNKHWPTDPRNPDTDFDGLRDGAEGDTTYMYSPTEPLDPTTAGGGGNPSSADTDGDGMPDGWEYRYGAPAKIAATPTEGAEEGEEAPAATANTAYAGYPDFTAAGDYDLDPDRDGLPNYQEYLSGLLRQNRYDLSPELARLYGDTQGVMVAKAKDGVSKNANVWKTLPDVYVATEDLLNPFATYSIDFRRIAGDVDDEGVPKLLMIDPLNQAFGSTKGSAVSEEALQMGVMRPAISKAFSRQWMRSIVFPTIEQLATFALNTPGEDTECKRVATLIDDLARAIIELDAAVQRLQSQPKTTNTMIDTLTANPTRDARQIRALVTQIDRRLEDLRTTENVENMQPVIAELLTATTGETSKLWEARKAQILCFLSGKGGVSDPAYMTMAARVMATAPLAAVDPLASVTVPTDEKEASLAVEQAVLAATSPLLQAQYRAALRGYTGGVWNLPSVLTPDQPAYYLGPAGIHAPVTACGSDGKHREASGLYLGMPLPNKDTIGANMPEVTTLSGKFFGTSPLVSDTDMDGMDDYFEIFHGLNPVLGDLLNQDLLNGADPRATYSVDVIGDLYAGITGEIMKVGFVVTPTALANDTAFLYTDGNNTSIDFSKVTGFDYYAYPWMAGTPQADPDGDGLLNAKEAVNPSGSDPAHYGTDPSPLWMTDPANMHAFTKRFYPAMNGNATMAELDDGDASTENQLVSTSALHNADAFPYIAPPGHIVPFSSTWSNLPYEINEGFDTDGDGISDLTELTSTTVLRGDPQSLRTPDRQQSAYFKGAGAMQTHAMTQFGPTALTTFTIECWVNPDTLAMVPTADYEQILIDRPWNVMDTEYTPGNTTVNKEILRHNFTLGLKAKSTDSFVPFVRFTGAGTTDNPNSTIVPAASPTVEAGEPIAAGTWTHLAATYNGKALAIFVDGKQVSSQTTSLIPANGVISLSNSGETTLRTYTYREAPLLIGAGPSNYWFADLTDATSLSDVKTWADVYENCYYGFIDEVRIWNGARTQEEIANNRSSTFTQAELLANRLDVFMHRYRNGGYFASNVPTELLASYSFSDLLAGTKADLTVPYEKYVGEKTIGGADKPGSLLYRRESMPTTKPASAYIPVVPEKEDLFTSYYSIVTPEPLKSTMYYMSGAGTKASPYVTESVPMAHNMVAHLPLMDVELSNQQAFIDISGSNGNPSLRFPSGTPENLKPADSVYWTPYAAGNQVTGEARFNVKTTGNPYGYYYAAHKFFDGLNYIGRQAYSTQYATDLMIYGDVFSKYTAESWDSSPSTDPSAGTGTTGATTDGSMAWFEYATGTGETLNDTQLSQGGAYLEDLFPGQTKDSDGDRMPNWWESYYNLDPEDATGNNGPHGDADGDYLTNYAEYLARSNPGKYSTAGNGVPDSQMSIWARRGRPTFGLLYTDNDFMEDHWEAANRSADLSVDFNDATLDADQDGWCNWAEARVTFRGQHSTDPNKETSLTTLGAVPAYPTPAISLKVDYFGDKSIISNDVNKIVVHAYTAVGNNSAPDAVFVLPMETKSDAADGTVKQFVGRQLLDSEVSGYLEPGNIKPGSIKFTTYRYVENSDSGEGGLQEGETWSVRDRPLIAENSKGLLIAPFVRTVPSEEDPEQTETVHSEVEVGTIDYTTGKYTYFFSSKVWSGEYENGGLFSDTYFNAEYSYTFTAGFPMTYTMVTPVSGSHLREGKNNFFVFMDLNENLSWDEGEPAGVVDQHDVEIGWDTLATQLHVNLTVDPPPGAVRLSVGRILKQLMGDQLAKIAALQQATTGTSSSSSSSGSSSSGSSSTMMGASTIPHPLDPTQYLDPVNFDATLKYDLVLVQYQALGVDVSTGPNSVVYRKEYNVLKPYLTEEEIFAAMPKGLPGTEAQNQKAFTYKVYLLPETLRENANADDWFNYNIAIVTNRFGRMVDALTTLPAEKVNGGAIQHNTDLVFEWTSNVQMPSFHLAITKTEDSAGPITPTLVYDQEVRGVSAYRKEAGDGANEQFAYRYKLPRGIGELSKVGTPTLFGDGLYTYKLTLNAYNGAPKVLEGSFRVQLRSSQDTVLCEKPGKPVTYNAYDSYYVRTKVRYNGVLSQSDDFGSPAAPVVIEAHTTASFNDAPVASTNDLMVYDEDDAEIAAFNGCVRITKDKKHTKTVLNESSDLFWSTLIEAELRGIPSETPVYLMAYIDLNQNGKRDTWEPWGYATMGLDATNGYYYDARAIKPVSSGKDFAVEFYIQDVDTDNDKLADSWEWRNAGMPLGDETKSLFASWCNTFTGTTANHQSSDIWTTNAAGTLSLTAFGAQLYGLEVTSVDANGAVTVSTPMPEDLTVAQELMAIIGEDTALKLFEQGYVVYAIDVNNIVYDATSGAMTLHWEIAEGTSVRDGTTIDLATVFADAADQSAVYTLYGTDTLGGTWKPLANVKVAGTSTPTVTLTADELTWEDADAKTSTAAFFKVILSTKAETL